MRSDSVAESSALDRLDRQIVRGLQISPRAPFRTIAAALDVSEQTVARRYRRMHRAGLVRVVGIVRPDALGQSTWLVRIQCRPTGAASLAVALGQRPDVSWVSMLSGGSEIMCAVRSLTEQARDELLVQRLPRTGAVLGMAPSVVLRVFVGANVAEDWEELAGLVTRAQHRQISASAEPLAEPTKTARLDTGDIALADALARDGRATYASLAAAAETTETRVARRLAMLLRQGIVYLDVDVATASLGLRAAAMMWLRVSPAHLEAAGTALSGEPEVAFAAAISGPHNLVLAVYCRDLDALYAFVTAKIGDLPGVQTIEVSPVERHVKQSGSLVERGRFVG